MCLYLWCFKEKLLLLFLLLVFYLLLFYIMTLHIKWSFINLHAILSFKKIGCACYPLLKPYDKHKLDFQSSICLCLGYTSTHKGYVCMSTTDRRYIFYHVIFNATAFPFALTSNSFISNFHVSPTSPSSSNYLIVIQSTQPHHNINNDFNLDNYTTFPSSTIS